MDRFLEAIEACKALDVALMYIEPLTSSVWGRRQVQQFRLKLKAFRILLEATYRARVSLLQETLNLG